jgi:glycosyltransferase involved in cell wall biosynthesis
MRIACITPGFSLNRDDWAIPALQSFASSIAQSNELYVFSLRYPASGVHEDLGFKHHAAGGGDARGVRSVTIWWNTYRAIQKQHRKTPFDVLHAYWADEPAFVGTMAAKRLGLPLLVSVGGGELVFLKEIGYGTQGSLLRRWIIRVGLNNANLVSTGSNYASHLARRFGVPADRMRSLPLGVDTMRFQPSEIADFRKPTIIQAASLTPVKNQSKLLEVFRIAHDRMPEIRLIVAGDGPLASELKQQANDLRISDYVKWIGQVLFPEMPAVYQDAHLYLQSSLHESQGMSLLESMACGLPTVGTPVGLLPEVSCKPATEDSSELAEQVLAILGDRTHFHHLRHLARKTVEENYGLDTCKSRYIDAYQSLMGEGDH